MTNPSGTQRKPPAEHVKYLSDKLAGAAGDFDNASRELGEAKVRWAKAEEAICAAKESLAEYMETVTAEGHTAANED